MSTGYKIDSFVLLLYKASTCIGLLQGRVRCSVRSGRWVGRLRQVVTIAELSKVLREAKTATITVVLQ